VREAERVRKESVADHIATRLNVCRTAIVKNIIQDKAIAVQCNGAVDIEGFPSIASWGLAQPIRFSSDWQGKHSDPERETEVRLLWTHDALYLRFLAKYREITVFEDAEESGRRDRLWDRDVCEAFLQPDSREPSRYKEFEVSPNGFWIDLDIAPENKRDLQSGLIRRVSVDEQKKEWCAELALPMKSVTNRFDATATWKANFYRVEGPAEPRFYSAWRPTHTPIPNFHVPAAFGYLRFQ
jgi:alpha-galactosidase